MQGFNYVISSKQQKLKVKTKFVDSMNFGIHCNIFFQKKSSFAKFSVKTICEKI